MDAPIQVPNFEFVRELGRGGMSRVYLARQLQPKREVAIKIVSPGSAPDPSFLASLKLEGDTVASLNHDNVVTVFACGVIDNHYYMAMEVLPGGDLTERIKKGLRPEDAVEVMIQIGNALDHAHKRKVLHRDIKPENVMFHESGKAVLVDFGIAKEGETESSFTQVGAVVGTPHYMSPERCMGKPTDARSDLYAMGVMFYEMLTGHKVFEGRDTFAVSYAHVYEPVPPLPPEHARFQGAINKLLAKDPKDRFQSAADMVAAFRKYRAGAPGAAEPATRRVDTAAMSPLSDKLRKLASDDATAAHAPVSLDAATAVSQPLGAAPAKPAPASAPAPAAPAPAAPTPRAEPAPSKLPLVIGGIAIVAIIAAAGVFWPREESAQTDADRDIPAVILSQEKLIEMSEKLSAATSQMRFGNMEDAANNFETVLKDYDCTNEEARRGLRTADPGNDARYRAAIAACEKQ